MVYKQLVESNGLQSNKQTVESDGLQTNKQLNPIFYKQTIVYKQQLVKSKPTHSNKRKLPLYRIYIHVYCIMISITQLLDINVLNVCYVTDSQQGWRDKDQRSISPQQRPVLLSRSQRLTWRLGGAFKIVACFLHHRNSKVCVQVHFSII